MSNFFDDPLRSGEEKHSIEKSRSTTSLLEDADFEASNSPIVPASPTQRTPVNFPTHQVKQHEVLSEQSLNHFPFYFLGFFFNFFYFCGILTIVLFCVFFFLAIFSR
jgi:hypothetical protein